ncbi:MAG TPA: SpoIID/LytB domain-containing protein [Symbiobacteriaceae bacterium]|nr:SpoIID/LytB domain-containing protein [Symbiobacteriaceae bacterium]
MTRLQRLFMILVSVMLVIVSVVPASAESDEATIEEGMAAFKAEYGESHAAVGFNALAPDDKHQIGNPKQPVHILRVGLRYSYTPTGGRSEFYSYNHPQVQITGTAGTFSIKDQSTGTDIVTANAGAVYTVRFDGANYVVADPSNAVVATVAGPVRFVSNDPAGALKVPSIWRTNVITWVGSVTPEYWGELEITRGTATPAGQVNLVNIIELETYLRGNVVNESPASFHKEALKCQAIVARGYAIANVGRFVGQGYPFDIDDSAGSQVYRGRTSEHPNGNAAVAETTGLVVTYDSKIISAYYSSSMGGYTENVEWSFSSRGDQSQAKPWLKGRYDGPAGTEPDLTTEAGLRAFWANEQPQVYDSKAISGNSRNRWTYTYTAAVMASKLNPATFGRVVISGSTTNIGTLKSLEIIERSPTGRATVLRATGSNAVWEWRNWDPVRRALPHPTWGTLNNPAFIDQTFNADGTLASVTIIGGAWGHNVGMSQYGAHGRGKSGQTFDQILAFYYKDTAIGSYPIDIDRDPSVSPRVWRQRFISPNGKGTLEIRPDLNAGRMEGMHIEVNGSKTIHISKEDLSQPIFRLDVTQYMQVGVNVVDFKILGSDGAASVQLTVN